ncbi:hypothetical protein JCM10212_005254 [Sporobolomyces blumeae]
MQHGHSYASSPLARSTGVKVDPPCSLSAQRLVVIGGGTGCNAILAPFQDAAKTTFVVPVSDDGGSTAEILRVLGGPALGDIRSRLVRLIPHSEPDSPLSCIRRLLEYRLPSSGTPYEIKGEWHTIVEGTHKLWKGIPGDRKETLRAFLVYFETAVLKKAQRGFDFKKASIGNLFLSGAFLFLGSIPSAIFLFASLTGIPHERCVVVPVINTASTATIAAELENGQIIAGQSEISHPSPDSIPPLSQMQPPTPSPATSALPTAPTTPIPQYPALNAPSTSYFPLTRATTPSFPEPPVLGAEEDDDARVLLDSPDPNNPTSMETRRKSRNVEFSKDATECPPLEARIKRVFYLSAFGLEIFPRPNGVFTESLQTATTLVYAPGSLYTSILPCLALRGVGSLISTSPSLRYKVLLLNSTLDRETSGYTALDFVKAISSACNRCYGEDEATRRTYEPSDFVSHVVYLEQGEVTVEKDELQALGIQVVAAKRTSTGLFDDEVVRDALERIFA